MKGETMRNFTNNMKEKFLFFKIRMSQKVTAL